MIAALALSAGLLAGLLVGYRLGRPRLWRLERYLLTRHPVACTKPPTDLKAPERIIRHLPSGEVVSYPATAEVRYEIVGDK